MTDSNVEKYRLCFHITWTYLLIVDTFDDSYLESYNRIIYIISPSYMVIKFAHRSAVRVERRSAVCRRVQLGSPYASND